MRAPPTTKAGVQAQNARLRTELHELQETLRAIREDAVDAFVIETSHGPQVFMLQGLDAASSSLRDEILATITDAVIVYGEDERVIYLNAAAAELYGVTPSDALGGLIDGIFRARWLDPDGATHKAAALRDTGKWRGECLHVTRAGESIPVEVTVNQLRPSGGQPPLWLAVIHAASERVTAAATRAKLEAQARELRRWEALGTLAVRVADDFGAMHGPGPVEEMGEANLEAATRRAQELRQQLLALEGSRISARPFVSVATILKEAARLLRVGLPEDITIVSSCAAKTPMIRADATQLMQALLNLGTNACHAMEDGPGTLDIRAAEITVTEAMARAEPGLRSGRFVRIKVSDSGCGMDADTQRRAFEPFFSKNLQGRGMGIGLTVVQGIVQAHQGVIVMHSTLNVGSTFELYLPCTA